jgi:hypothetical protein
MGAGSLVIVCGNLGRDTKPSYDSFLQIIHDYFLSGLVCGDRLYPPSKIIRSCQDPSVAIT